MGVFKLTEDTINDDNKNIEAAEVKEEVKTENKDDQEIKLDGPLSSIYAKALNIAYAKEGLSTMLPSEQVEEKKGIYVYCCNGDELNGSNVVENMDKLRLALDSKRYNKVIAVIESTSNVSEKLGLLDNYVHSLGIETMYNRHSAIAKINNLRSKKE